MAGHEWRTFRASTTPQKWGGGDSFGLPISTHGYVWPAGNSSPRGLVSVPTAQGGANMIDLYYWPTPNGWKITIFLEEAAVPYRVVAVDIAHGEQFTDEFLKIS